MAGPGAMLRSARESLDVAQREVADALNLPIHIIEAMETNDFANLPAAVFTRGYLRSYARLLDLDSDILLEAYPQGLTETNTPAAIAIDKPVKEWVRQRPAWILGTGVVVGVVLLIFSATWWWSDGDSAGSSARSAAVKQVPAEPQGDRQSQVAPQNNASSTDGAEPAALQPGTAAAIAATVNVAPVALATAERGESEQVVVAADFVAAGNARRITAFGDDLLEFEFTEECWVEVKSATGTNLYSDLNRAGQSLRLIGQAPFRILLGYAPGVRLAFNDEGVALAPHTRNNVAMLVLGQ